MSVTQQGAALQACNNELVSCIDELHERRRELARIIKQEEEEETRLLQNISVLTDKVGHIRETIAARAEEKATLDRAIAEANATYMKILESSESLLSVVKNLVRPH
ncbi:Sjoegren syndrome nuclear autoantigen 1 [Lampris incognitus]|uniref:Sjoegren syndrome nuclear autoantigen 1 n=1 Tax=Lampris incognitus TaxID=2546036 RepID=UPI0024B4DBA5|nr:Sjoegren syndrome nuclear autoantigen 1 [Lampris incognitus]